jgi:hypothetical protein
MILREAPTERSYLPKEKKKGEVKLFPQKKKRREEKNQPSNSLFCHVCLISKRRSDLQL